MYWLTGGQLFMDFPPDICSPSNVLDLLGSTVWCSGYFYHSHFGCRPKEGLKDSIYLMHKLQYSRLGPMIVPSLRYHTENKISGMKESDQKSQPAQGKMKRDQRVTLLDACIRENTFLTISKLSRKGIIPLGPSK